MVAGAGLTAAGLSCPQCGAPVDMPKHAGVAVCASCGSTLALEREPQRAPQGAPGGVTAGAPDPAVLRSVQCPQCAGLRESTTLLFYPLWLLRYRDGNRLHRMVVNGRDGTVNSATAPAAVAEQVAPLLAKVASMAVVVAFLVWLGIERGAVRVPALVAAVIVSVVAVLMARRFRVQREVEYHEPFSS